MAHVIDNIISFNLTVQGSKSNLKCARSHHQKKKKGKNALGD